MEVGAAAKAEQERRSKPHGRALSRHLSAPVKQVRCDRPADLHGAEHIVRDYRLAFVTELHRSRPALRPPEGYCLPFGFLFCVSKRRVLTSGIMHASSTDPPTDKKMLGDGYLVTPPALTMLLREAASNVGHQYGIKPKDISARSMRASGAMTLLCADVDP
ncbi:hypothetical protein THAOC_28506, partial [Thalassiosira oceanica]